MNFGLLVTLSCVLTGVTMAIYSVFLFILLQSGSRGVQAMINRFFGGGRDDSKAKEKPAEERTPTRSRPQISSGDALRQRAQQLEFNPQAAYGAQAASGFTAQGAPQQASLTSRDPLRPPTQNPQYGQQSPSMPSLSSGRTFQPGTQPRPAPTQGQYGQTPPLGQAPQQYGQQPGQYGQTPPLGQAPQQFGQQARQYGQQSLGQPQQYGQQPGQYPQSPQQGGVGQYRPPLQSRPNFNPNQQTGPGLRRNRDNRKGDDRETYYEDGETGIEGIIGDFGDLLG